jgi:putative ABC transport system ATP-binding protein
MSPSNRNPLVRATQISKTYGAGALATPVLFDVDLTVWPGELTLLMGPSGSGKTTLISILAGLLRPTAGRVELCGVSLDRGGEAEAARVRRSQVGFVFQQYNLFPALSAFDNVAEVLRLKGYSKADARQRAQRALERVGLAERAHHLPGQLSGGQKQRVAIARALSGEPSVVFGDEVTGALDGKTAGEVMELIRRYVGQDQAALIVTHDRRLLRFADRVVHLEDGRIVSSEQLEQAQDEPIGAVA